MCGPSGTVGSGGGAPRLARTVCTSSDLLSDNHCKDPPAPPPPRPPPPPPRPPPPNTSLTRTLGNLCVRPVVSPTQISMPAAVELVKAKWLPSGLQCAVLSLGFGGSAILISVPSGILRNSRLDWNVVLCSPLVFG